jgi:hypothetical protein
VCGGQESTTKGRYCLLCQFSEEFVVLFFETILKFDSGDSRKKQRAATIFWYVWWKLYLVNQVGLERQSLQKFT